MIPIPFYPRQLLPVGTRIDLRTPQPEKYLNDVLHPCVRKGEGGAFKDKYIMVQSPLYGGDESMENPILYVSDSLEDWGDGVVVRDTPSEGYNSDPLVFPEGDKLWVFWREFNTPACFDAGTNIATFGCCTKDGRHFSSPKLYLANIYESDTRWGKPFPVADIAQCPILMKHNGEYYFYGVCMDYKTYVCKGLSIWKGSSLEEPDFKLQQVVPFHSVLSVGKFKQLKIRGKLYFIPKPVSQSLWHFDLFEHDGCLYMIFGVAKGKGNILLSCSKDWMHFKTRIAPLINNNHSENTLHYRQYYYKSTGFVENGQLHLFYTANSPVDRKRNVLFHSCGSFPDKRATLTAFSRLKYKMTKDNK